MEIVNIGMLKGLKLLKENFKMENLYEPKNRIYVIRDKDKGIAKIIGKKEDLVTMKTIEVLDAHKNITNSDIQNTIFGLDKMLNERTEG